MHVSSLGEFEQGRPVMERWKAEFPNDRIMLSFYSPSGFNIRKNYPLADLVFYLPLDTPKKMNRLLDQLQPDIFILVKYDFWPNLLRALHQRKIPSFLISARFRRDQYLFKWWGSAFLRQLRVFRWIFVQDEASEKLLKSFDFSQVVVAGDTRVDAVMNKGTRHKAQGSGEGTRLKAQGTGEGSRLKAQEGSEGIRNKVIIGGSTWPEEERMLANLWNSEEFKKNKGTKGTKETKENKGNSGNNEDKDNKDNKGNEEAEDSWKLVIAPHDISESHLTAIESLFGGEAVRLSRCQASMPQVLNEHSIILIDSIGLLSSLYEWADIAIIGGGFGKGIHNTLEPAAYGLPIVFGPKWTKFREAESLIIIGAAFQVNDQESFSSTIIRLCSDAVFHAESGILAIKYMESQRGSTDLIIRCLLEKW